MQNFYARWLFLTMTTYKKSLLQSRICQYSTFCSQYLLFAYVRVKFCVYLCVCFVLLSLAACLFICSDNTAICCAYFVFDFDFDTLSVKKNVFSLSRWHWYCYSSLHFMLKSFFDTFLLVSILFRIHSRKPCALSHSLFLSLYFSRMVIVVWILYAVQAKLYHQRSATMLHHQCINGMS